MENKLFLLSTILISCIGITGSQAQKAFVATGGDASGNNGSVSYSFGQVIYQTHTGTNGTITEGVQQPYEISVVTGTEEEKGISTSLSAYPNPATDHVTLEIDNPEPGTLSYQMYDITGRLLQQKQIKNRTTNIKMRDLAASTYLIRVHQNEKVIKSFKIIKNK